MILKHIHVKMKTRRCVAAPAAAALRMLTATPTGNSSRNRSPVACLEDRHWQAGHGAGERRELAHVCLGQLQAHHGIHFLDS
jgi:hypothetical protein